MCKVLARARGMLGGGEMCRDRECRNEDGAWVTWWHALGEYKSVCICVCVACAHPQTSKDEQEREGC